MSRARTMRDLLEAEAIVLSPGVYDGYSARLVERAGFSTASTTGAGIANSRLGVADTGVMGMLENVEACRAIARSVCIPVMADADTGYGNALSVHETVQRFEEAGIVGVNIEDQVSPKRCGHMAGKELVSVAEMCAKIRAATDARRDPDFVICARTDAIPVSGLDDALHRIRAYADAGADMVFPDAVRSAADVADLVAAVDVPVSINMGFGIRRRPTTPLLSIPALVDLGVRRVSLPRMLTAAAIQGMSTALSLMASVQEVDDVLDRPDLLASIEDITALMGYERIAELEQRYATEDELASRYGAHIDREGWVRR